MNIESIDKNQPHYNVLALCLECNHKWIGTVPARAKLFELECSQCETQNSFASFLPDEYLEEFK